jgi:hypothetical protein
MGWIIDKFGRRTQSGALNFWILLIIIESIWIGLSLAISIAGLAKGSHGCLIYGIMMTLLGILCVRGSIHNLRFTMSLWLNKVKHEA